LGHAGILHARAIVITFPDPIGISRLVRNIRRLNPNILLISRTRFDKEVPKLYELGVDIVVIEELEASLLHFSAKYDSKLLKRSVSILIEGLHAGGELADLLNKIALNIDEMKIMKKEMAANVMTYAIFILFAAVAVAPFLFALATQLLEIIVTITSKIDLSSSSQLFSLQAADPVIVKNFRLYSVLMLMTTAGFSACIVILFKIWEF